MSLSYIRDTYKVPARWGVRVTIDGEPGRILSARGPYLMVLFDGDRRPLPCHPTWRVVYHAEPEPKKEPVK